MTTDTAVLDAPDCHAPRAASDHGRLDALGHAIEHAAHYLPAQGPITVFIHHNTLHAFEDLSFDEGVQRGARLFGCEPYLAESRYRAYLHAGRIRPEDIDAVLLDDLGDAADVLLGFMGTRFHFRRAMLQFPLQSAPPAELEWFIAETNALKRFRLDAPDDTRRRFVGETKHWTLRDHRNGDDHSADSATGDPPLHEVLVKLIDHFGRSSIDRWSDATWEEYALQALWRICERGVSRVEPAPAQHSQCVRLRDSLAAATGRDIDELVHGALIRLCAAFLDQGLAPWPLPERERGLWAAFAALARNSGGFGEPWLAGLNGELDRIEAAGLTPLKLIDESLAVLGVADEHLQSFLIETLLALRGWAGMIQHVQSRPDRVAHPFPSGSLVEFLAVRLVLERLALAHVAQEEFAFRGPLDQLASALPRPAILPTRAAIDHRAFQVFQLAQVLGWLPPVLAQLAPQEWARLIGEVESFSEIERRRIFHAAYERRYRNQALDAVALHAKRRSKRVEAPAFQIVCCIDEREESFRRHLEELQPRAETFGAAGFFGVAIYYRGAAEAHFVPLCPVVIRPQHWVVENVPSHLVEDHRRRALTRRTLGSASHSVHLGSRSALSGALVTGGLGVLASIPLVARVLFPRLTARIRSLAGRLISPPPQTVLEIERSQPAPGPQPGHFGYTVEEMTGIVERLLQDIGLTSGFARLVFVFGHGSVSLNNPHESAHDCGACGGGRGGPNARAWARMANDPRVRAALAAKGLAIPATTVFIGGYHNTCDESLTLFDLDRVPASHAGDLASAQRDLDEARLRDAHERSRRVESAPLSLSPDAALRHVEARAEDLAQVRPEYGHATNAMCFVGRRSRTRGLFMDRRAFLTSYDPTQDDAEHTVLTRLLAAVVPVCAGISLEYYFSYVDNTGYGCGTKLPHNITSLLGVMDGAGSDLRTGLPWQMVEIHEPVRSLFVIETTPLAMTQILDRNPTIGKLFRNGWVQLATLSPDSAQIHLLHSGRFVPYGPESSELPEAASSVDWYRGWRDHLGFAQINAPSATQQAGSLPEFKPHA